MENDSALRKFYDCIASGDRRAAKAALEAVPLAALNTPDETGRTPLARFVAENDAVAVGMLLRDGRSDWSIAEGVGSGARYTAPRTLKKLFERYSPPDFFYRNGEAIPADEVWKRVDAGTLAVDEALFDSLEGDFFRAMLAGEGKVSKADFEKWMETDRFPLYWEAQIALLLTDPEYAQKFVDWEYIRSAAEANEWLSFLRDLPEYADEADWDKLALEGDALAWRELLKVRPEFAERYRRAMEKKYADEAHQRLLKKYYGFGVFNFLTACRNGDVEAVTAHLETGKYFDLNENFVYPMPPGFLQSLPLAEAVKANSVPCVRLLLAFGADPDAFCRKNEKTPRELAADRPEIRLLFEYGK